VADEKTEREITPADWGRIHAMAWRNDPADKVLVKDPLSGQEIQKDFSKVLETDPTAAITSYFKKFYPDLDLKSVTLKIVKLRPPPDDIPKDFWEDVNPFPPSCC
jgi:hypothetical protein